MIQVIRETHEASCAVDNELRLAGGCNRFGEANYRAVWGWSRLGWIGGSGRTATRRARWCARWSSCGSNRSTRRTTAGTSSGGCRRNPTARRKQWCAQTLEIENGRNIAALGPYPSRGEYEHCLTLEGARGEFVQLTPAVARHVARLIEASRHAMRVKRREALDERVRREEHEYDTFADALLSDAGPAFHGLPRVGVNRDS